ncbi:nuclear transport factor 2 family protein [Maribrevibacterium harenarium]|uniref:Nuclear transport factor 2 family protein n=1 Tax=Maribrevibacterium harenarium TaxID=2589817 RepID=A0A501WXS7_9GAMM|nr:nuclear transport factor 2 family protein [Maribrevibacterium harenarium]TPE54059.1 nuclear transport factor 2 family protein [Maribrevibacterium harenarium]
MSDRPTKQQLELIERFKNFYKDVRKPALDSIGDIYASDVRFKDPVHEITGMAELHAYLADISANVESGRFEFLDQMVSADTAYIKWNMYFRHPKLGNKTHVVRGMSQVQFNDRITYHEDVYDMGQMLYEHIPFLGRIVRGLKNRLAVQ